MYESPCTFPHTHTFAQFLRQHRAVVRGVFSFQVLPDIFRRAPCNPRRCFFSSIIQQQQLRHFFCQIPKENIMLPDDIARVVSRPASFTPPGSSRAWPSQKGIYGDHVGTFGNPLSLPLYIFFYSSSHPRTSPSTFTSHSLIPAGAELVGFNDPTYHPCT